MAKLQPDLTPLNKLLQGELKVGSLCRFWLTSGQALELRYDGQGGQHQRDIWFEPATGAHLDPLPPYEKVEVLSMN